MTLRLTRRDFVKTSASAVVSLGGLGALAVFSPACSDELKLKLDDVRLTPDIAPLVRLIETTPRDKIVAAMIEQLKKGVTYRQFLAAMFLAATRARSTSHNFFLIHAAHQLSLNGGHEERLLPLFWALDSLTTGSVAADRRPHPKMNLSLAPSAAKAAAEFDDAMRNFDSERAEVALLVLGRHEGDKRAMSRLWHYAARDWGFIGHLAIAVSNAWRTLETIGWQHAEPVVQFVVRTLNQGGDKKPMWLYPTNVERSVQGLKLAPPDWAGRAADEKATRELFALLRDGDQEGACRWTYESLTAGQAQAATVWDAIFLCAADFLVRYSQMDGIGARPVHLNTAENALHFAFSTCEHAETRFYLLLQAVAWAAAFVTVEKKRDRLRDVTVLSMPDTESPNTAAAAVEATFDRIPTRKGDRPNAEVHGPRASYDKASHLAFAFARAHADHGPFLQTARRLVCLKATTDAHNVKFPAAIFENYEHVSPRWRPHLLAASVHSDLHGTRMEDNAAVKQAREALRRL